MQRSFKVLLLLSMLWNGSFPDKEGEVYWCSSPSVRYPCLLLHTDDTKLNISPEVQPCERQRSFRVLLSLSHIILQAGSDHILGCMGKRAVLLRVSHFQPEDSSCLRFCVVSLRMEDSEFVTHQKLIHGPLVFSASLKWFPF